MAALQRYEDFLNKVIQNNSDQYPELQELLQRHRVLEKSNIDLNSEAKRLEKQQDDLKKKLSIDDKAKANHLL